MSFGGCLNTSLPLQSMCWGQSDCEIDLQGLYSIKSLTERYSRLVAVLRRS